MKEFILRPSTTESKESEKNEKVNGDDDDDELENQGSDPKNDWQKIGFWILIGLALFV